MKLFIPNLDLRSELNLGYFLREVITKQKNLAGGLRFLATCLRKKDCKIMSSRNTHKEQFYYKLKIIKKSNNRLISHEHLELVKKYLSDQHQQTFSCNDLNDAVGKKIKKRIKMNKFTLVNT